MIFEQFEPFFPTRLGFKYGKTLHVLAGPGDDQGPVRVLVFWVQPKRCGPRCDTGQAAESYLCAEFRSLCDIKAKVRLMFGSLLIEKYKYIQIHDQLHPLWYRALCLYAQASPDHPDHDPKAGTTADIADMVHGSAQTRATSLMFKLSWKMSQDAFLEQLNQLCGISKFQYNFVHLPWKQLAIVNFTRSEICDHCFQVVKQVAGIPGVCIANIQGGMHQGLEANLAYFCAKCGHKSDYNTLPLILVNGEEVPLVLACRTFVTDALLNYYSERLQAQGRMPMAGHKKGKTYQTRTRQLQMPLSYQGADKPDQHNQLNLGIPLDTEYHHTHDGASIIVFSLWDPENRLFQTRGRVKSPCCAQQISTVELVGWQPESAFRALNSCASLLLLPGTCCALWVRQERTRKLTSADGGAK